MSLPKRDRNSQTQSGNTLPPDRFVGAIAGALHRQYDGTRDGMRTVVSLTGANAKTVRNWFEARNGPNGSSLVALCRHSDEVLGTVLNLAGRPLHSRATNVAQATAKAGELLSILQKLNQPSAVADTRGRRDP